MRPCRRRRLVRGDQMVGLHFVLLEVVLRSAEIEKERSHLTLAPFVGQVAPDFFEGVGPVANGRGVTLGVVREFADLEPLLHQRRA